MSTLTFGFCDLSVEVDQVIHTLDPAEPKGLTRQC